MTFGHAKKQLYKETGGDQRPDNSNLVQAEKSFSDLSACLKWTNGVRRGVQSVEYNQETGVCTVNTEDAWGMVSNNDTLFFMCVPV